MDKLSAPSSFVLAVGRLSKTEIVACPVIGEWDLYFPPGVNNFRDERGHYHIQVSSTEWRRVGQKEWVIVNSDGSYSLTADAEFHSDFEIAEPKVIDVATPPDNTGREPGDPLPSDPKEEAMP